MLIARKYLRAFFALESNRSNLGIETAAVNCALGALLRAQRVLILLSAGDLKFARQNFGGFSHYHLRHRTEKSVAVHAVNQFLIPKTVSPARTIEVIRQPRHRFGATGQNAIQIAIRDFLKSERD